MDVYTMYLRITIILVYSLCASARNGVFIYMGKVLHVRDTYT